MHEGPKIVTCYKCGQNGHLGSVSDYLYVNYTTYVAYLLLIEHCHCSCGDCACEGMHKTAKRHQW